MLLDNQKIKVDVLLTWPSCLDYPLWRWLIANFRTYFEKVIIAYYIRGETNFIPFLKSVMKKTEFIFAGYDWVDWRERCVNTGLNHVRSDYVLFTEQDFLWKDDHFLEQVFKATREYNVIGINQGSRYHPCFLLVKKEIIDKTSKNFSVIGKDKDHFWQFSQDLKKVGKFIDIRDLGLLEGVDWFHFSSLTWNLYRIKDGDIKDFHDINDFLVYNSMSRIAKVPQDPRWILFTYYADFTLTKFGRFLNSP